MLRCPLNTVGGASVLGASGRPARFEARSQCKLLISAFCPVQSPLVFAHYVFLRNTLNASIKPTENVYFKQKPSQPGLNRQRLGVGKGCLPSSGYTALWFLYFFFAEVNMRALCSTLPGSKRRSRLRAPALPSGLFFADRFSSCHTVIPSEGKNELTQMFFTGAHRRCSLLALRASRPETGRTDAARGRQQGAPFCFG